MNDELRRAQEAINDPEVKWLLKRLAKYGLGIYVPHEHTADGEMIPLRPGIVQLEKSLSVTFIQQEQLDEPDAIPVGWMWNEEKKSVWIIAQCCG